jgi:hypothetical protein
MGNDLGGSLCLKAIENQSKEDRYQQRLKLYLGGGIWTLIMAHPLMAFLFDVSLSNHNLFF